MTRDETLHQAFDALMELVYKHDDETGLDWYYAEHGLYIVQDPDTGALTWIKRKSPGGACRAAYGKKLGAGYKKGFGHWQHDHTRRKSQTAATAKVVPIAATKKCPRSFR